MAFSQEDVRRNHDYFLEKLSAERQLADVQRWVNGESGAPEFVLLDTRAHDAFAKAHIPARERAAPGAGTARCQAAARQGAGDVLLERM